MSIPALPYQSPLPYQRDIEHIKLLVIFSYIWGALIAVGACVGMIYIILGTVVINASGTMFPATAPSAGPTPAAFGWIVVAMGAGIMLFGWTIAGLNLYSARSMQQRKRRTFSLVVAGINCISFPFGTAMGVFTFVVLLREPVAQLYQCGAVQTGQNPV